MFLYIRRLQPLYIYIRIRALNFPKGNQNASFNIQMQSNKNSLQVLHMISYCVWCTHAARPIQFDSLFSSVVYESTERDQTMCRSVSSLFRQLPQLVFSMRVVSGKSEYPPHISLNGTTGFFRSAPCTKRT